MWFQFRTYWSLRNFHSCTNTSWPLVGPITMKACMKSFQIHSPQKMITVIVQGVSSGKTIRQNVLTCPQPSMAAASSNSRGIVAMNAL